MQITKFPRLLHTIITEPVKVDNTDFRFIECIAVVGNTTQQLIKLLFRAVPVERFGEFDPNRVVSILKSKIKNIIILPFCVLRDVKRQFLYTLKVFLNCTRAVWLSIPRKLKYILHFVFCA